VTAASRAFRNSNWQSGLRVHWGILACGRSLYPDLLVTPSNHLPGTVKTKIISFGEYSYGAYKVALVMSDGRRE
jgi:hypothetical protein